LLEFRFAAGLSADEPADLLAHEELLVLAVTL
jgi:hypothetical protein